MKIVYADLNKSCNFREIFKHNTQIVKSINTLAITEILLYSILFTHLLPSIQFSSRIF